MWDGLAKSAVFYTDSDATVYEVVLSDGFCTVPAEVLVKPCYMYIGVRGVNDSGKIKTSTIVKYKIVAGAPRGTQIPAEPSERLMSSRTASRATIFW